MCNKAFRKLDVMSNQCISHARLMQVWKTLQAPWKSSPLLEKQRTMLELVANARQVWKDLTVWQAV